MGSLIADNLRLHMQRQQLNPRELARRAEVKSSFVYDVLSGRSENPSTLQLSRLAASLHIPLSILVNNEISEQASPGLHITQHAAFDGWFHPPHIEAGRTQSCPYGFSHRWLMQQMGVRPDQIRWCIVPDDVMEPSLTCGDLVLIDQGHTYPNPSGHYLIGDGEYRQIRRLELLSTPSASYLRLIADNPCYATYEKHADSVSIIGRIIWTARPLIPISWGQMS